MLGLLFAPLMLVGLIPLFYGTRKVVYGSMGLGIVEPRRVPKVERQPAHKGLSQAQGKLAQSRTIQ